MLILPTGIATQVQAADEVAAQYSSLRDFGQLAPGEGWILIGHAVFWTADDGSNWTDITPAAGADAQVEAVHFLDPMQGRVLLSTPGDLKRTYTLAKTQDSGASWEYQSIDSEGLRPSGNDVASVFMNWRDGNFGWLVFKFATGSNFSAGTLLVTKDGGMTWERREIPLGEPANFVDENNGWVAGGPARDQLFYTPDGGITWEAEQFPGDAGQKRTIGLPDFDSAGAGILTVVASGEDSPRAEFYLRQDMGNEWSLLSSIPLFIGSAVPHELPYTALEAGEFVLHIPGSQQTVQFTGGEATSMEDGNGNAENIIEISMADLQSGWGKWVAGDCITSTEGLSCSSEEKLVRTSDGGASWNVVTLPSGTTLRQELFLEGKNGEESAQSLQAAAGENTQAYIGHGFDLCEIPSLSQMQTWWNRSPYNAVNLYIGGSSRACSNAVLSASYLSQLNAQGWRFIPTWVGPQASCSGYYYRMSSNVVMAYDQGVAEANAALVVAQNLGLTAPDKSGTVIYYDLEAYNTADSNCRAAADAFISGWVARMHAFQNLGAVYGASCGSAPTDWASIANPPDALWVANWYGNPGTVSFDREASVWDAYCLSNSLWSNHQRLRQYAGDHNESWGGVPLNIDSNVLDGPLAVPNGTVGAIPPSVPTLRSPADGSLLERNSEIWLQWKTTGDNCSIHVWGGSINESSNSACSQYYLGARGPGAYSWQVAASNEAGSTIGPVWGFNVRPSAPTSAGATAVSANAVDVTWQLSADEPSSVDGYRIYANGVLTATTGPGISTFRVTGLSCNVQHAFYITAFRQGIGSHATSTVYATTPTCAPVLNVPSEGQVTESLRPIFSWESVTDATGYQIQISVYPNLSAPVVNLVVSSTGWDATTDMAANKLYYWRVRARGPFGSGDWSSIRTYRTASPPSIPVLLSPVSGALTRDYSQRLDWADSTLSTGINLDHYEIRVSTDSKFGTTLFNQDSTTSEFIPTGALNPNQTYYWKVRAFNTLGQYSSWSGMRSFRTAVPPPHVILPESGSMPLHLRPTLDWSDVEEATSYTVQLSIYPNFSTIWFYASPTGSAYSMGKDLPKARDVYWRVRANATNGPSAWSSTNIIKSPNPPSTPALYSPVGSVLLAGYSPVLDWSNSIVPLGTNFAHYEIQLAKDPAFSLFVQNYETGSADPLHSTFTLPAPLESDARFYWRVRSFNSSLQYSTWSATATFRTRVVAPKLLLPTDGAALAGLRPTLNWADVPNATSYTVQFSGYPNFSTVWYYVSPKLSPYTPGKDLPRNRTIYWRVRTNAVNGPSAWSLVYSIQTPNPPTTPLLTTPTGNVLISGYAPQLDWSTSSVPLGTVFDHYHLQIAKDLAFTVSVQDYEVGSGNAGLSVHRLTDELMSNTRFFWRARAFNTTGQYSSWSSIGSFRTRVRPPNPIMPSDGDVLTALRPTFGWDAAAGASSYSIQVSRNSTFTSLVFSQATTQTMYMYGANLPVNVPLFWRVRTNAINGPSAWSETPSFQIVP